MPAETIQKIDKKIIPLERLATLDKLGMGLSFLCALHCILTPLIILSMPMLARYYLAHPLFHLFLGLAIVPVGLIAFVRGYRHHRNKTVFIAGLPGLAIIAFVPYLVHRVGWNLQEQAFMVIGSALLIYAHVANRRSCACENHHH